MKTLFALVLSCVAVNLFAADDSLSTEVARENYAGWADALTLRGGDTKLIVVPSAGGRVLHYSLNGENLIYENASAAGKTLATTPNFNPGGGQMDIGPELRGIPRHNDMWNGAWRGGAPKPNSIFVVSPAEFTVGVQMEKEFVMDPKTGEVGVTHRLRNIVTNDVSFCFWDRTLCRAGGYALIPMNKKSRFKAGWAMRRGDKVENYAYDGDQPADRRAKVIDGVLVVQARDLPDARFLKVGTDSDAGWIAYTRGKLLYVKHFPVDKKGTYTDGGCTTEFYCDARLAEVEPLSPEYRISPGKTVEFPEKWTLLDIPAEATSFEKARELVKRIPKSPFK